MTTPFSARELAELAGVTIRTIRRYHQVGLLPPPTRLSNGYRRYGVTDLVALARIRRLTQLGFSLGQISAILGNDRDLEADLVARLDAHLASEIRRLQRMRDLLASAARRGTPPDVDADAFTVAGHLGTPDQMRAAVVMGIALSATEIQALVRGAAELSEQHSELQKMFSLLTASSSSEHVANVSELLQQEISELSGDLGSGVWDGSDRVGCATMPATAQALSLLSEVLLEGLNEIQQQVLSAALAWPNEKACPKSR